MAEPRRANRLIADHGHQPFIMLRWAAHNRGVELPQVNLLNLGSPQEMEAAFRAGQGDYVHLQGGVPQQLERDGVGHIVAFTGEGLDPLAFSSIAAPRAFVESDRLQPLLRAFAKAKTWAHESPAEEVASTLTHLFPALRSPGAHRRDRRLPKVGLLGRQPPPSLAPTTSRPRKSSSGPTASSAPTPTNRCAMLEAR